MSYVDLLIDECLFNKEQIQVKKKKRAEEKEEKRKEEKEKDICRREEGSILLTM